MTAFGRLLATACSNDLLSDLGAEGVGWRTALHWTLRSRCCGLLDRVQPEGDPVSHELEARERGHLVPEGAVVTDGEVSLAMPPPRSMVA